MESQKLAGRLQLKFSKQIKFKRFFKVISDFSQIETRMVGSERQTPGHTNQF